MCSHQHKHAWLDPSGVSTPPHPLLIRTKVFSTSYRSQAQVPGLLKTEPREGPEKTLSTLQLVPENQPGEADPWVPLSLTPGDFHRGQLTLPGLSLFLLRCPP